MARTVSPGKAKDKFDKLLRRIVFFYEQTAKELVFLTNDMESPATEIAELYKRRWQIELFFKWIKQNLELKCFMTINPKAVRLQIITALIAFVALKLLHHGIAVAAPLKRLKALCKKHFVQPQRNPHPARTKTAKTTPASTQSQFSRTVVTLGIIISETSGAPDFQDSN